MASALKNKVTNLLSTNTTNDDGPVPSPDAKGTANLPENYRLLITAGPNYDKTLQRTLAVNSGASVLVSDEIAVTFRVANYTGFPTGSPRTSGYFSAAGGHGSSTFSLAFSIRPSADSRDADIDSNDLWFGLDMGHNPIRKFGLPKTLVRTAIKIATGVLVDPSLSSDPFADEPWIMGPVFAGATRRVRVRGLADEVGELVAPAEGMEEGGAESGVEARRAAGVPDGDEKRRKYFSTEAHRKAFPLQRGRTYEVDFANGFIDWEDYKLKLPGLSVGVLKYVGKSSHKVRFVLKNIKTGEVHLVVMATLLTGADLQAHVEANEDKS